MAAPVYPPPPPGVTRITQSKLETYLRCGIRWDFERQDPTRHATVRMLVGSGVAAGAAEDNHAKITRGSPASLGTIIDAAVAGYDLDASESEVPEPKSEISRGRDDAAAAARCFGVQVSPALPGVIAAEAPRGRKPAPIAPGSSPGTGSCTGSTSGASRAACGSTRSPSRAGSGGGSGCGPLAPRRTTRPSLRR